MRLALLIDFGSTYTKVTLADLNTEAVLGTASAFSTVETDITEGLFIAVDEIERLLGLKNPLYDYKVACSSATGGLKMVAIGLVPDLTVEAAKRAVLGAGAKVSGIFAHELTGSEIEEIESLQPDIILLAGGTDGGNATVIMHNARMIAGAKGLNFPVIVAGNKSVSQWLLASPPNQALPFVVFPNPMQKGQSKGISG